MNRLISIFLLLLILLGSFKDAAIFISFKINQNYIAKNLCVERDLPESTCRGCCQLNEKLNETHKQEQNTPEKPEQKNISTILFYFLPFQIGNVGLLNSTLKAEIRAYLIAYSFHYISACFHPPKLV